MTDTLLASPASAHDPMPSQNPALASGESETLVPVYTFPRLEIAKAKGVWVTDRAGRTYLDFVSGIAVNAFGHAPAGLATAVAKQMRTLVHSSNLFTSEPVLSLAKALTQATGYPRVFFSNSGTEAIEGALKFARARARALGRPGRDILAFKGGFHGRTGFAVSATWTPSYREPFEPLVPGVRFADFNDLAALEQVLDENVCAVVIEPVQGESGVVPATAAFLKAVRDRATQVGAALILDEIQCGMGRCGRLLASETYNVRGDLVVLSKALAGGVPLGAVLATEEIASHLSPGMHGSTFGGGPVACAAGNWMLARISKPTTLSRVRKMGRTLMNKLQSLVARHPSLSEARGLGLLTAIEIAPDAGFDAPALVLAAREYGLLLVRGGDRAVRLLPPLNVTPAEIEQALERLDQALTALEQRTGEPK
jgi:predicted acetylornithine/succinylornithine family transaminase